MVGSTSRGLDGLTADELAASRRAWWNDAFTDLLFRRIPGGTRTLVDVGCGLATAAHTLLPMLTATTYVGVDADAERVAQAHRLLAGVSYRERVELLVGRAECLPLQDGKADVILTTMTLQHLSNPRVALRECSRVLRSGGRLVVVEPDYTATSYYFDRVLDDVTATFRELSRALRRHREPVDICIGPAVATFAERESFSVEEFFPYVVGEAKKITASEFLSGLAEHVDVVAASLTDGAPQVQACRAMLSTTEAMLGASTVGYGCWFVPLFVCVGTKQ